MINKDKKIKVFNKFNGVVGYTIPDTNLHRNYYPNQTREVTYDELEKVFYTPGGERILKDFLEIQDEEVIKELFSEEVEPEYHYSREDIKKIMTIGSLDQFLDCLDFAPMVTKEIIKDMAVDLPLNDVAKRQAILDKLGFDVTKAIEIKNTKYDGDPDVETDARTNVNKRRAAPITSNATAAPSGRRYVPISKE